jgi:membrane protease YdiL (CAAX protease family)
MASRQQARRSLAIFFPVLILGTAYFERKILLLGGSIGGHRALIYGLMWWVTISSLVARTVFRESLRDVSFRWGGWNGTRAVIVATVLPLVVGFVAYGIAWNTGLAHFRATEIPASILGIAIAGDPSARFLKFLLLMLTIGSLYGCKAVAGEEIGWRGYMLTRLIDSGVPAPLFISGAVWALWHTPLILSGQYASGPYPVLSAAGFFFTVIGAGYIFAWLRLSSGSVWPAIWAHAVWNAVIQGPFDGSTNGYSMWVGESGLLVAAMTILFAIVLYRVWPLHLAEVKHEPTGYAVAAS